jgi:hypothetical protein
VEQCQGERRGTTSTTELLPGLLDFIVSFILASSGISTPTPTCDTGRKVGWCIGAVEVKWLLQIRGADGGVRVVEALINGRSCVAGKGVDGGGEVD